MHYNVFPSKERCAFQGLLKIDSLDYMAELFIKKNEYILLQIHSRLPSLSAKEGTHNHSLVRPFGQTL